MAPGDPQRTPEHTAGASIALFLENEVIGRGLEAVLNSLPAVGTVWCCSSRREAESLLRSRKCDFAIAAVTDAEWLADVCEPLTGTKVLLIVDAVSAVDPTVPAATAADGYLAQRDLSAETLAESLRRTARGELPMPSELARALLTRTDTAAPRPSTRAVRFTGRESETLALLAQGLSNKQIAHRLSISSHGAKRLVGNIMLKLDAPNRTAAVVNAIEAGLLEASRAIQT